MRGLHPTVTEHGLCNDGCFQMETTFFDGNNQVAKKAFEEFSNLVFLFVDISEFDSLQSFDGRC